MRSVAAACGASLALLVLAPSAAAENRYELSRGCYGLQAPPGQIVGKDGDGYRAGAAPGETFRMQATALGKYLLYGTGRDFLALNGGSPADPADTGIVSAPEPSGQADWTVEEGDAGGFQIISHETGKALGVGPGGRLAPVAVSQAPSFSFIPAQGCPEYPEVDLSVSGMPFTGSPAFGETRGLIDLHMHHMAFEFLGGSMHCGRPWHPYGAPYALVDCPDHEPNGCAAVAENVLYGSPARCHDPVGWPTFNDWPHHKSLTHEQSYYRWLERAWMGGLRVFVNLFVENGVLCEIYPIKRNSCDEMESVRLQNKRIEELQDYIDAQAGAPGKGFYRIVTDPFEARRVINDGKLAVIKGIEISRLFGCRIRNEVPQCDRRAIDRQLNEVYGWGVRQMELINKFDNALGGVAGDSGTTGLIVNPGNQYETGKFWQMQHCEGENHDHDQISVHNEDNLIANGIEAFMPAGALPLYPHPPHCNTKGLTDLGEYLVREMMERGMLVDPDHLSVLARKQLLAVTEAHDYPGVVSSHSWSTYDAYPRIQKAGGVITPYAGSSTGFVKEWRKLRPTKNDFYYWGFGYGADMNGFGSQGGPRGGDSPVTYPFKSFDGGVTIYKQRSGSREFDINHDGVAHYGLYPDWVEDLRHIRGDQIVQDMARGSEAYLQMWERAAGVPRTHCLTPKGGFKAGGFRRIRLGRPPKQTLFRAGQPLRRTHAWTYCVKGRMNRRAKVVAVFTKRSRVGLVASTARLHTGRGIGRGTRASRLHGARRIRGGLRVRRLGRRGAKLVYGVRRGRVRFVAVVSRPVARNAQTLRRHLRLAGL